MKKVGQVPASLLLARHRHIEAQLSRRDKWLEIVRFLGIIATGVTVLSAGVIGNISPWVQTVMYLFLIGFAGGAILVRAGSDKLQGLSFTLKKAGERLLADQVRRRQRKIKNTV